MKKYWLVLLITTPGIAPSFADDPFLPEFRVAVEVNVSDDDLKDRVSMYFRNELRRLGGVLVTPDEPDYKLFAMVMEMRTSTGGRVAYVLSISVTKFFPEGYFDSILNKNLRNAEEVSSRLEEVTVYENQFLSLAGPTEANLIEVVTNSVAKFNAHILEPKRQPD